MDPRAGKCGDERAAPDADALDRRDRHERLREPAVQFSIPLDVAAEAGRHAVRDDLEGAAHRVAGFARLVDLGDHPALQIWIDAVQRRGVADGPGVGKRHRQRIGHGGRADAEDVADDLGLDLLQQLPRDRADRDPRSRLASRGALEDVPDVVVPILDDSGEIGVPGPGAGDHRPIDAGDLGRGLAFDGHGPLPVLPVLVRDEKADRSAGRHAVPDAGQDLRAIRLDGHPPAAAVAGLAPAKLSGDRVEVEREARRHPFENGDERLAVRLAGGEETQHQSRFILSNSVETTLGGAGTIVYRWRGRALAGW